MEHETTEKWSHIDGLPLGYEISSLGNARINYDSFVEPIKIHSTTDGYHIIHVLGQTLKIHRLVAQAFLDNPEHKTIVKHKDRNIANNSVNNLEWATYQENSLDEWNMQKRSGKCVRCIESGNVYQTLISAEAHLGIPINAIENSAKKGVACFGLHFEYVESTDAKNIIFIASSQIAELSETLPNIEEFRKLLDN